HNYRLSLHDALPILKSRRHFLCLAAAAGTFPRWPQGAAAQNYPSRPVRLIVGFAPGRPTDVFARLMAQGLSERLGKQCYVENLRSEEPRLNSSHVSI